VATSRRRERELARRRFERRRQAELERRAKAKKRNRVVGAVVGTAVVIAALVGGGIAAFGGSSGKKADVKAASTPTAGVSPAASPTATTPAPAAPTKCAKISPNPPAKGEPTVPDVKGTLSTKLVTKDIKVGTGPAAKSGDNLIVKYIGISCSTGKVFDASYTDPANATTKAKDFPLQLGKGQVIPGWDQGLVGMKAGGVRELIIPAALGYGTNGTSGIKPNETLIFLVTMVKV
jgi:FKBP-type peptidyl-prolyl cis-trans isomerase